MAQGAPPLLTPPPPRGSEAARQELPSRPPRSPAKGWALKAMRGSSCQKAASVVGVGAARELEATSSQPLRGTTAVGPRGSLPPSGRGAMLAAQPPSSHSCAQRGGRGRSVCVLCVLCCVALCYKGLGPPGPAAVQPQLCTKGKRRAGMAGVAEEGVFEARGSDRKRGRAGGGGAEAIVRLGFCQARLQYSMRCVHAALPSSAALVRVAPLPFNPCRLQRPSPMRCLSTSLSILTPHLLPEV